MRLLDLFCGAGGASMGYHRAGWEVVGVDIAPQPHYPFPFVQADALTFPLDGFDAVHASPPCQASSAMNRMVRRSYPQLIPPTRARLQAWAAATGGVYAIENVEGAPLENPWTLCGTMFGLETRRHRLFEVSLWLGLLWPCNCRNGVVEGRLVAHRNGGRERPGRRRPPRARASELRDVMGCDWMTAEEARQAIPPAYTEWIGRQLLAATQPS